MSLNSNLPGLAEYSRTIVSITRSFLHRFTRLFTLQNKYLYYHNNQCLIFICTGLSWIFITCVATIDRENGSQSRAELSESADATHHTNLQYHCNTLYLQMRHLGPHRVFYYVQMRHSEQSKDLQFGGQ
jgi:hypothetical protein